MLHTAGFDETELQIVRAESKQRLEELEAFRGEATGNY